MSLLTLNSTIMAGSRQLVFCVLLISLSVCCDRYPQQTERMKEKQTGVSTRTRVTLGKELELSGSEETLGRGRVKRKAAECSVMETKGGTGFQKIIDANAVTTFNFFIQPQPGFNSLAFRAKLNNKLSPGSWKYSRESLVVSSSRMEVNWTHPTWISVEIEYFKKVVSFGPDRHALRVKVGRSVNEELITRWWRTHSYEGFAVEAEGPLKVLLNCHLLSAVAESLVDTGEVKQTVLVACVVGGCFLLVVGATALYLLITGRSRPPQDYQFNTPPVPTSLLRGRRVKKDGGSENIYESIDEGTLKKLRQNFDADKLISGRTEHVKDHCSGGSAESNENTKTVYDPTVLTPCHSSGVPNAHGAARDTLAMSLLEQKEALRHCFDLDSPVESHYVEMHGIVSRTSSLKK